MKKLSLIIAMMVCSIGALLAQRTVTGTVTDTEGEALIGASVFVRGTSTGTVTDVDGAFSIEVDESDNTLVVSYTGFTTKEVPITTSNTYDITLAEGVALNEVVVTGLGIKKEEKTLGYGVSTIQSGDIQGRQEADVARILRGRATGVDITQTSGLAGSGTNVIIRGFSSITGDNQPLFVVDGVPINTSTNATQGFGAGGASASSRFLDLDPNIIEEVSILKGLSATVLYGEAGRNGVILVTTKNGSAGSSANKGLEVSVTQQFARSDIANLPDYQNTFGNGFNAGFGWFFSNWGAAFADTNPSSYGSDFRGVNDQGQVLITHPYDQAQYRDDFPEFIDQDYVYQPYESVENFFQSGFTSNTSVSVQSKLGNNSSMSATYSYLSDEGFLPKLDEQRGGGASNFLNKHNFGLGAQTELQNGLKLRGSFNFVDSERRAPITGQAFGGDGQGVFAALLFTPRSIDLMNLPYQSPIDGRNVYYRRGSVIQNPRWVLNNGGEFEDIQRFFSTTEATYEFTPWLTGLYRLGIDQYSQKQQRQLNRGGAQLPDGQLSTFELKNRVTDQLFNLLYNFQLSDNLTLDGILGFNARSEVGDLTGLLSSNQFVYGLFTHDNFIDHNSFSGIQRENTLGAFITASLGIGNYLYLNFQGRNDWTSTLEAENNSIFYPSISAAFVPTDAFSSLQGSNFLNYLKVRIGYGTSAGYPQPYQTRSILNTATLQSVTRNGTVINTNSVANQLGNANLRPELITELEGGIDARFFQNRFGIDLSLYNKESSDLIIAQDLDPATGFTSTTVNGAAVRNRGVELGLNIVPFQGDFKWDITLNYTRNVSEVLSIAEGVDEIQIRNPPTFGGAFSARNAGFFGGLGNYAIVGEQYGIMQGQPFVKDENGNNIVDGQGNFQGDAGISIIGDPNPDFQANWINSFSFKGFSFGFQWQYVHGGDIYSSTVQALLARGNTVDTDVDRSVPLIMPNTVLSDGTPNNIQTYIGDSFFRAYFFADEGGVFDATVIRLREVSVSYAVPARFLEKSPFGQIGITLAGENLWYNAPNFPEGLNFDPEVSSLGVGNGRGFDFRTAPTSRRYGLTVNASF